MDYHSSAPETEDMRAFRAFDFNKMANTSAETSQINFAILALQEPQGGPNSWISADAEQ